MAEFQEVTRQRERMCGNTEGCNECELNKRFGGCNIAFFSEAAEYERIVMQWASEHPEPVHPTWREWQEQNFPDARFPLSLCHFTKGICPFSDDVGESVCIACRKMPIPADIAKRLGIAPLKGESE